MTGKGKTRSNKKSCDKTGFCYTEHKLKKMHHE